MHHDSNFFIIHGNVLENLKMVGYFKITLYNIIKHLNIE